MKTYQIRASLHQYTLEKRLDAETDAEAAREGERLLRDLYCNSRGLDASVLEASAVWGERKIMVREVIPLPPNNKKKVVRT